MVNFGGDALGMCGDFGNSHQFADAASRQWPADENAIGRAPGCADRTALAVGIQTKTNRIEPDQSHPRERRNRRVGPQDIGVRRSGRHDHTVESIDNEAALATQPLPDANASVYLFGADNRCGAIGKPALGSAAIEHGRDLWRNAEAMHIPQRAKMTHNLALLG
ncbi:hypothetical protein [Mesorhizobium sp. M0701]|uniref:hypothetical protein n=1 Tax=Mesorhizobium sp. M0701 TaxID=2956989 RepID=UPI003335B2E2